MHPEFLQVLIDERVSQTERSAARSTKRRREVRERPDQPIGLRLCRVHDRDQLLALAQLEGRPLPEGSLVVAELAGAIVAALPLDGGSALADPFRATAEILPLLELRAAQLRAFEGEGQFPRRALRWLASRG